MLLALLGYLALGQDAMHGIDAFVYLQEIARGELHNPQSAFYQPLGVVWTRALAPLGIGHYEALRALSACAAAAGVLACLRAARTLGRAPGEALAVAAATAALPAVAHAASVVEIDAVLFACTGLAWLPFARLLVDGRARWAALTGACTALAAGFHAAGHLLALQLAVLHAAFAPRPRAFGPLAARSLLLLGVHLAVLLPVAHACDTGGQRAMAANTLELPVPVSFLPTVLWREWLLPYAPFCLLALLALRRGPTRGAAAGWLLCAGGYLLLTTAILGNLRETSAELPHGELNERGSFLLALALPTALLGVGALPRRWRWPAIAASAVFAVVEVTRRDWPPDPPGYAGGYRQLAACEPMQLLVADVREWAWIARREPAAACRLVAELELEASRHEERHGPVPPALLALRLVIAAREQQAQGRLFCISERALERLRVSPHPGWAAAARTGFAEALALEPVAAGAFRAFRVVPH